MTLSDKQVTYPAGDAAGRAIVVVQSTVQPAPSPLAANAWLNYSSGAALIGTAGLLIGGGVPGRLRSILGVSTAAATDYYLVGVDKATAPVANDVTLFAVPLQDNASNWAGSGNGLDFGSEGMFFAAGIAYAISTTPQKVTLAAVDSFAVFARYIV